MAPPIGRSIAANEAQTELLSLIEEVNKDRIAVEIVSEHGNAVLISLTTTRLRARSEAHQVVQHSVPLPREVEMSITASEARKELFPLIKKVNEDHDAIEIVSKHGNAVLVSREDYAALREGAYLLRSPANARRLLKAYENALNDLRLSERQLIDPAVPDAKQARREVGLRRTRMGDYTSWVKNDRKMFIRINNSLRTSSRPVRGIGKPEPLKNHLPGAWSRRIDDGTSSRLHRRKRPDHHSRCALHY